MNLANGLHFNSELEYLSELIKDFPPSKPITADTAINLLSIRYEELEKNISVFINNIKSPPPKSTKFPFKRLIKDDEYFPAVFYMYALLFHKFLFKEILSNAGKFRNIKEFNNGRVGFGGHNPRMLGSFKFSGTNPNEISLQLTDAFILLRSNLDNPIENGLEFYRRFVRIHPFYDANGRIGRLILNIYFQNFGFNINWRELEAGGNKTKFIKKLNACHKRENRFRYPTYFKYLLNFFKKFITDINHFYYLC